MGPLEVSARALDFMDRAKAANKPFFLWWNSTRMHIWAQLEKESVGKTGLGVHPDGMVEHDVHVGQVLATLTELGLGDGTIVNDIVAREDILPTLLAAAGDPTVVADLKKGRRIGKTTDKVHLDGYDLRPALGARLPGFARNSSTGPTTGASRPCATTTGRRCSSSSVATASTSGRSPSSRSAFRSSSTCAAIPSSARTTRE